jgi:hypothetical protein
MVKKQDNITLNMDLGKMTGKGKTFARVNRSSVNRKKDLFEEVYLEENKTLPKRDAVYNASAEVDNIPQFGDYTLKIPPFFAVPSKTGWRLANPLTAMRNLANRQKELSVNIKRANVPEPELVQEEPEETPTFDDFSAKDQAKLVAYFEAVKQGKEEEYLFKNRPRGFPAVLYKNAKKAGLKQTKEKVYTKNVIKKQPKIPKAKKGPKRMEVELQEDVEPEPEAPKQNKRAEEIMKKLDEYEKTLKLKTIEKKDFRKIQSELVDIIGEINKDKTLKSLIYNRIKEINALFKSTKDKYNEYLSGLREEEERNKMGAEDIAGQKLREAEKEEKAKAKAAVERFKAKAKAKKLEEEKARDLEEARKILERNRAAKAKTTGGELPKGLNPLEIIPKGLKAVKDKVVDIAQKVIKGRDGYSPSVTAIIEKFADQEVKSIELHRRVLPTVYTGLLNVLTLGEFNKRIKDQPKDKLFHISMWVKLANGKTVLVEKNEVINMKVNPKKEKEEEVQPAGAVPAGLKFGEMLDKTQKEMGSKYFTYSARDNNCGNYIEAVLKANGMNTKETNDFIGQDAKAILKGYPRIAKLLNVITDTAGRANVLMEGGGMGESDCDCGSESECECDDKEMNGEGLMSGRGFHVATMTNRFHRIPQSEAQIKSHLQGSSMKGSGSGESRISPEAEIVEDEELTPEELRAFQYFNNFGNSIRHIVRRLGRNVFGNRFSRLSPADRQLAINFLRGESIPTQVMNIIYRGLMDRAITEIELSGLVPRDYNTPQSSEMEGDGLGSSSYGPSIAPVVTEPAAKGKGLKKPKFAKGSQEAKDYMKMLRDKRGKK